MDAAKLHAFVARIQNVREAFKADMQTIREQIAEAELDPAAVARLASWMDKDETDRLEREAVDDQYRFLAGVLPTPAELPEESQIAKAAALYADKMTVRAVAKEMGVSVGRAHKLKVLAAAFTVHERLNVNTPAHDQDTGEIIEETADRKPLGGEPVRAETEAASGQLPATPIAESSGASVQGCDGAAQAAAAPLDTDDLAIPDFLRRVKAA